VCPTGALYKDDQGFTGYAEEDCIGCGYCTQFCPYGVPQLKPVNPLTGNVKIAKCTFCQDRIYSGIGGPFCATVCPVGAQVWGTWDDLLGSAKERVSTLHEQGLETARLYGENEVGGLRRLTILLGEPGEYNLPTTFPSLTVSSIWQNIIQWVGGISIVATTLGAVVAFLFVRSSIRMEEVE
jgi:formate dehydrogenase iron-sulfur subunit